MQNTHRTTQLIGRAALVTLLGAPALGAQGGGGDRWEDRDRIESRERRDDERRLFTWRGTVENNARIYIRGQDVETRSASDVYTASNGRSGNGGRERRRGARVDSDNSLPRRAGVVRVQLLEGRGRVYVVQQPNAGNDYTAILQVRDAQRGSSRYRFAAYFDPTDRVRRGNADVIWSDADGDVVSGDRVLRWSGNVDGDVRIAMWRGQLSYDVVSGQQPQNVRSSAERLPMRDGRLSVSLRQGRGVVYVAEQPSASNGYTAVIRVLDREGGSGHYDFDVIWR